MRNALVLSLLLAACGSPAPPATDTNVMTSAGAVDDTVKAPAGEAPPAPGGTTPPRDLAGRWTGVEGMYLVVAPTAPGRYRLEMQYDLDNKGVFEGRAVAGSIAFARNGREETLRPSDGDATGLKYLAGKRDCLTVRSGEGYCRG